jgi:hypothetical protein
VVGTAVDRLDRSSRARHALHPLLLAFLAVIVWTVLWFGFHAVD